jgi:uncharacterized protein
MFLPRKLYPKLQSHLTSSEVTVLTGMRRTGKTTLIKHLLSEIPSENKVYFDCENITFRELFSEKTMKILFDFFQLEDSRLMKPLL